MFAIAGLDGRTINSKSLIGFGYQGDEIPFGKECILSTKTLVNFGTSVTEPETPCHRKY